MTTGLDNLKHIVVLMMENRSFDHMLGALKSKDSQSRRCSAIREVRAGFHRTRRGTLSKVTGAGELPS
jgi:phospholipase C